METNPIRKSAKSNVESVKPSMKDKVRRLDISVDIMIRLIEQCRNKRSVKSKIAT